MHPFLFEINIAGHLIRPPTYGVLLALSFSAAYFESLRRAIKEEEDPKHIENLFLSIVVAAVLGARLFHVFFEEPSYYFENPSKIFAVWEGGYTFYGALLCSIFAMWLYCKIKKLNLLTFYDIAAPSTLLGLFFGRLGCFFAGCCWGKATSVPWAVTFTNPESFMNLKGIPVHPTQIYESIGSLLLYFFSQWRYRHRKYVGQIYLNSIIGYCVLRIFVEFFRGDDYRGYMFGGYVSYSQFVSLMILVAAGSYLLFCRKKL